MSGIASTNPSGIKSIQRGTISVSAGGGTGSNTAAISPAVDTAKTELRLLGWTSGAAASIGQARVVLTSGSVVTASVDGNVGTYVVSWELTEVY